MSGSPRRRTVPGNRWDLVLDEVDRAQPRSVAVIVPYYEQPDSLARMYAALADLDPAAYSVVVADDGSSRHPAPAPSAGFPLAVRIVRQDDQGCRPGAARNLGALAADAEVLVFLDADTVPAPGTVARLAAWPDALPDALVVGRRHHADLTGWSPAATVAWLRGERSGPPQRDDPAWLDEGYRSTRDLLDADERSYRYVISAVMACHRTLYDDVGGFDAERDEYGGEDWEFAARAFNNGAVLVHERRAVAWHDEPDWSERDGGSKNDETLWLAETITEPSARGPGVIQRHASVLVTIASAGAATGALVAAIGDVLQGVPDARVHLDGPVPEAVARYVAADPRIHRSPPTPDQRRRALAMVRLAGPVRWSAGGLRDALGMLGPQGCGRVTVTAGGGRVCAELTSTRAAARVQRAGGDEHVLAELFGHRTITATDVGLVPLEAEVDLAALFGGW